MESKIKKLLLNEVQRQESKITQQAIEIRGLKQREHLVVELQNQQAQMQAVLLKLENSEQSVAKR